MGQGKLKERTWDINQGKHVDLTAIEEAKDEFLKMPVNDNYHLRLWFEKWFVNGDARA
jgi:hypothetical protein